MLPTIRRLATMASRKIPPAERSEFVAEVVANSFVAYARLVARKEERRACATVLARFAIAQTHGGRRVGNRRRIGDVLSPYAQRQKNLAVAGIYRFDHHARLWTEIAIEDPRPSPSDRVAWRLDYGEWLRRLPAHLREIALSLAAGETTSGAVRFYRLSPGRVSQIRQSLRENWQTFQGEEV